MADDIVIRTEGLGKKYIIGHESEPYVALRDVLAHAARSAWLTTQNVVRGAAIVAGHTTEEFWALKDVSFDVTRGEVVGIIGRNGAGKSTLLKIFSRITEPTKGRVFVRGRVSSLLEVGTGFHRELTGRENIFVNGAILGMTRHEIRKKFDEIIAFAEIDRFLDTPVKHYSSGMYVRLAFAVAAHLEPEILIVDEVLAVGDAEFQQKCLGKLQDVAMAGRTVLFVSHNVDAIERLTSRCLLLSNGMLVMDGPTHNVVTNYLRGLQHSDVDLSRYRRRSSSSENVIIEAIWTETTTGEKARSFRQGESFCIKLQINVKAAIKCDLAIVIETGHQHSLFATHLSDFSDPVTTQGMHTFAIDIQNPNLRSGDYLVSCTAFSIDHNLRFDVVRYVPLVQISGALNKSFPNDMRVGDIYVPIKWQETKR